MDNVSPDTTKALLEAHHAEILRAVGKAPHGGDLFSIISTAVRDFGFTTVVAAVLIWALASGLPADVKSTSDKVGRLELDLQTHEVSTRGLFIVMQQICVNTARDDEARRGCFPGR